MLLIKIWKFGAIRQFLTFAAMKQKNAFKIFEFFLKRIILSAIDDDVLPHVPFFPEIKYLGIISTVFFQTSLRLRQNIKLLLVPMQKKSQNDSMA